MSVTDDGTVAHLAGVVDVAAYGPSSREIDPMDVVGVGQGAVLGFVDTSSARARVDRLGYGFGGPPPATCPTAGGESPFAPANWVVSEGDFAVGFLP